jgi:hypothetical protein
MCLVSDHPPAHVDFAISEVEVIQGIFTYKLFLKRKKEDRTGEME